MKLLTVGLALICLSLAACDGAAESPTEEETEGAVPAGLHLGMVDAAFEPDTLNVPPDMDEVSVHIQNDGEQHHTFTIRTLDLEVDETFEPGEQRAVNFEVPEEGVEFFCRFHMRRGMRGQLTVLADR